MCDSDTDSDILESAVYGTQDACKNEATFTIKTEENSTSDSEDSIVLAEINNFVQYGLTKTPLVYTTRLDDMKAFKRNKSRSCKEAAEIILAESKPRYVQRCEQIYQTPLNNILRISYIQLCSCLQQFNINAKKEACERIAKKLTMCKPLKIVLTDIMKMSAKTPKSASSDNESSTCYDNDDDDLLVPVIYSSDEDLPLSAHCGTNATEIKCNRKTTVVVRQNQSQEADIYIFNNGLISYYKTDFTEYSALHRAHRSEKLVLLQYCCWVKREEYIKNFIKTSVVAPFDSSFMRKPHNCEPKLCICCCDSRAPIPIIPKDFMEKSYIQPVVKISEPKDLIKRAFTYRLEDADNVTEKQDKLCQRKESKCYLKCAVIVIKYLAYRVIYEQTKLLGEYYVIGNNGMIESYVKPTTNRSFEDEMLFFKKCISKHDRPTKYLQQLICCWYKREEVLAYMRNHNRLSPNALRFIRSPHLCKSDQCKCCCKSIPNAIRLENITIQKRSSLCPSFRTISVKDLKEKNRTKERFNEHNNKEKRLPLVNTEKSPDDIIEPNILNKQQIKNTKQLPLLNTEKSLDDIIVPNILSKQQIKNTKQLPLLNTEKSPDDIIEPNILHKQLIKNMTKITKPRTNRKTDRKNKQNLKNNNVIDLTGEALDVPVQKKSKTTLGPSKEYVDVSNLQNCSTYSQTSLIQGPEPSTTDPYNIAINNISLKDLKLSVNSNGKLTATINARPQCLTSVELKVISDILAHASKQITQLGLTPEDFCKRVNLVRAANLNSLLLNQAQVGHAAKPDSLEDHPAKVFRTNFKADREGMQCIKVHRPNEPIPKTKNKKNILSNTYQNMSHLGGHKGMHLTHAYWLYLESKLSTCNKSKIRVMVQARPQPDRSNIKSCETKATNKPVVKNAKRKITKESTNTHKKIRVKPAAELLNTNPQPRPSFLRNVGNVPISNNKRHVTFFNTSPPPSPSNPDVNKDLSNGSTIPTQIISATNVTQMQPTMETNQPPPLLSLGTKGLKPIINIEKNISSAEQRQAPIFAYLPKSTQAAVLNKHSELGVSENNPMLHQMLSCEPLPPLVPIRLEPRQEPRMSQPHAPNVIKPGCNRSKTYNVKKTKQYSGPRKAPERNINKTSDTGQEPLFEDKSTLNSMAMDLVVFTDDDERNDGIFGA